MALILLGACAGETRTNSGAADSPLHDDHLTVDLRTKPSREDFGLHPDEDQASYERGIRSDGIETTVLLPTGTFRTSAFLVTGSAPSTDEYRGSTPPDPNDLLVQRSFASAESAFASLRSDAPVLGISLDDLDLLFGNVADPRALAPGAGVLNGLVDDWLALWVDVTGSEEGETQVNYTFTIDRFHNDATDQAIHDGVFSLDLTRRPSRADLTLRDGYVSADVEPAWNETLTIQLTLPSGFIERQMGSIYAASEVGAPVVDDPTGTGPPVTTSFYLATGSIAGLREEVLADAGALGIDPIEVDAVFTGPDGQGIDRTLSGRSTAVYDVEVRLQATPGQPGDYAASAVYEFTYH